MRRMHADSGAAKSGGSGNLGAISSVDVAAAQNAAPVARSNPQSVGSEISAKNSGNSPVYRILSGMFRRALRESPLDFALLFSRLRSAI